MLTGAAQRALALAAALVLAKVLVVALRASDGVPPPSSFATPLVLVYQDAWVVLAFLALDIAIARPRLMFAVGLVIALYAAINVPVARLFSTPLTASMVAAIGGALSDSAGDQMTLANVAAMLCVPSIYVLVTRTHLTPGRRSLAAVLALAITGPLFTSRVATLGVHRNALVGLIQTALPAPPPDAPTFALPDHGPALDLTHLAGAARGKNVVLIVLESHGARYLPAYDPKAVDATPNLTRLLSRALVFDRVTTPYPESIKGLFAYLCSASPLPNAPAARHAAAAHDAHCLSSLLHAQGYRTGLFHSGHFAYLGMRDIVRERDFDVTRDALDIRGPFMTSFGTDDRATARALLAWLDEAPSTPFFAAFLPIAGHHPYHAPGDAPRPYPDTSDRSAYLNDLHVGDVATGLLLDGLRARGLDDTLIVVIGDHGQAFQEHPGNFAHTLFLYEENLHVPFAITFPGAPSLRVPQRGSLRDLAPTVLALLGQPPDPLHEGRSLLEPRSPAVVSFTDHRALQFAVHASDDSGDWKLILDADADRAELFDLTRDPLEKTDLTTQHPAVTERLTRYLRAWHAQLARRYD